ncbi:MAG: metal-dependent transcriptional regulator [Desulfobacteraceae bacterium]|nr:MAG: metal-dependent transcriptional regulator [Desulfobacteraceae bacterium]
MNIKASHAAEDYLKVIYEITRGAERASTNEIADRTGVTPASATGMVQKLSGSNPPLLDYEKHRGVALTTEGEQVALEIIRHHRLLETFLQEKLGYTWDQVHDEADRLEHVISEEMEERIARTLGNPSVDPHGEPIPSREFHMPDQSKIRLAELQSGARATVVRIHAEDPDLLRYLASIGLTLNSRITVTDVSPFDGNTSLRIEGVDSRRVLGPRITEKVFVMLNR